MKFFDSRAFRVLLTAGVFALCLFFVYLAWRTIIAFIFAVFFAYLLEAPVEHFARWLHGRGRAIAAVYVILFGGLAILALFTAPRATIEAERLSKQLPEISDKISNGQIAYQVGKKRGWSAETQQKVQQFMEKHRDQIVGSAEGFMNRAAAGLRETWWLLLVPILAVFFLKDGAEFRDVIVHFFEGRQRRQFISTMVEDLNSMLGHYMRAQLALAALAMVVITLVLWAMRVPYSFAIGPAAGALEFIPVVGPIIGGALVLAVAFGANYDHLIFVLIFLLIWRGIQDYITAPKIMGGKLELHPLAVLFGVLAGGEVGGVIGVFLSIPIMAAIRILWRGFQLYRTQSDLQSVVPEGAETVV